MPVRACAVLALIAFAACRGSDPQPLEFVWGDDVWSRAIAGGGSSDVVAYSRYDMYTASLSVRFLRHDAARPDDLRLVGDVDVAGWELGCLFVSGTVAVFCAGGVTAVDLASGSLPTRTLPLSTSPQALAAQGRWLLAAAGNTLTLVDLEQPSPAAVASAVASASVTAVLATNGLFFAFTTAGYVRVAPDAVAPVFAEVEDASIRNFRAAYPDGVQAIVAGPSAAVGRSRVARLEFVAPPTQGAPLSPVLVSEHEVPAPFAAFAWDGGTTSIVAIASGGTFGEIHEGHVVHEGAGSFTSAGIPLPPYSGSGNPIAAHADRLFAIGSSGIGMYRINR